MGIEFVAGSEVPVLAMSMKWLRDNGPRDLFMGNTYAMKPRMSTDDLRLYAEDIHVFLQSLQYIPYDPNDEDSYEKFERDDVSIDSLTYSKFKEFQTLLEYCVEQKYWGEWSI